MTNIAFNILVNFLEEKNHSVTFLCQKLFLDEHTVKESISLLQKDGYLNDSELQPKAVKYLEEHKIDNAIILAAGMSTRFVPLNYETPKGLLPVKGEPLVERQIKQLRERGINEIIIVVGYMKDKFEYLVKKYGVTLVESTDYEKKNNHASVYAARKYLKNSIITSSDLYFTENIFQTYAYDSYYSSIFVPGKTAERGIELDEDEKILKTMYGDKCYDTWVTLGYAFFSKDFSRKIISFIEQDFDKPETAGKFWADIQDDHLSDLYMYAKKCDASVIKEFDSLEELREFDSKYLYSSESKILKEVCYKLGVAEKEIVNLQSLKKIKFSLFMFDCRNEKYACDVQPDSDEKLFFNGRVFYQCHDKNNSDTIKLFKMDKNVFSDKKILVNTENEVKKLFKYSKDFIDYHKRALPLCAAENVVSDFVNIPLALGFQERYIMNNTYSFNMDDNFIGCERLFPFYQMISDSCERLFFAKYTDPRPFTGMHCIDMITKTVCKPGKRMMILGKEYGGHASVQPVVERLGIEVFEAPYNLSEFDLDYVTLNKTVKENKIDYILLAPSDIINPLDVERIDTSNCILLWDCSQLMGLIAAGLCRNPLKTMKNVIMFGGTHKTFPGPASGLIMTNDKKLHDLMETSINPKYLRHSQMHQKISLLFSLIEFEKYGTEYMSHMVHCSNYLGEKLKNLGFDVPEANGQISRTHQVFIRTSKELMNTIYDNAYKCEVTLNKKSKKLFSDFGIRLGTQEIARYDWNDEALDKIAVIIKNLAKKDVNVEETKKLIAELPSKKIHYTFDRVEYESFLQLRQM
ncbi:MAG: NTP transferase domain-containing protein [Treponema sp.]|nr:NTP transferase domain-containing protein [Treponema sp.]